MSIKIPLRRGWALAALALCLAGPAPRAAVGGHAAAPGATLVACNASAVKTAVEAGGQIVIECVVPTVLSFADELRVTRDTTIDGGGRTSFSGGNARRLIVTSDNLQVGLRNLTIRNGRTSDQGGGVKFGFRNRITISNVTFENNTATKDTAACDGGGAIFIGGASVASIDRSTFSGNSANNGGAINSLRSRLTVTNSRFSDNSATHTELINRHGDCGGGGAIYIDGGRPPADGGPDWLEIVASTFDQNTTNNHGGAIFAGLYSGDWLTIDRSTFTNNRATYTATMDSSGTGGAIWYGFAASDATNERLILSNSTLSANSATKQGGGLWVDAPATITNVTFDGNIANDPAVTQPNDWRRGNGGALAVAQSAPVSISHATFARNQAGFNGGAIAADASVSVGHSLFVNNTGANPWAIQQHCTASLTAAGANMQHPPRNPSPNFPNETNCAAGILLSDPQLGALADNGGPTRTIALPAGSPALDIGSPAACAARDQRNYRRTGACDLGAFERGGLLLNPSSVVYLPLARR